MHRFTRLLITHCIIVLLFCCDLKAYAQNITTGLLGGNASSCFGVASPGEQIQFFPVFADNLTGNLVVTAPPGFEVSQAEFSGYNQTITLAPSSSQVSATIYVRLSASATLGVNSGNVVLVSPGAATQTVAVTGTVWPLSTANTPPGQTVINGDSTTAVKFSGTGNTFTWVNDTPGIGLAASGIGTIPAFVAVNNGSTPVTATITVTPQQAALAYVANTGSNTISVVNTLTNTVDTVFRSGGLAPNSVALSPNDSVLYILNSGAETQFVRKVYTKNDQLADTIINVSAAPLQIIVSSNGKFAYVANYKNSSVDVINTETNTVVAVIQAPVVSGLALNQEGTQLYIADGINLNQVMIVNTANNTVSSSITLPEKQANDEDIAVAITASADGSKIYVSGSPNPDVFAITNSAHPVIATIPMNLPPGTLLLSPDGSRLYVDVGSGITQINTATNGILGTLSTGGSGAAGIAVSPDGSKLYVTNSGSNTLAVIDPSASTITTIPVGKNPVAVAVSRGGCEGLPVTFTITVTPKPLPVITAPQTLPALHTVYGVASSSDSFTVTGAAMRAAILVTPPTGYEVSTDNVTFSNTVTFGTIGTIAPTTVYIRLTSATPAGGYPGNVVLSSIAVSVNVAIPGTVTPAPLTIIAANKTKFYNTPNPVLTVTYQGFVNNEGPEQLTSPPIVTTTAVITSPVGQYPINVDGAVDANYAITYQPGILNVVPYIIIPNTFTPNGDGINDTWEIKNLGSYPDCTVEVFSRYGQQVFSSIGYGIAWNGTYSGSALPVGTYYYIINLKIGIPVFSGFVAIIR